MGGVNALETGDASSIWDPFIKGAYPFRVASALARRLGAQHTRFGSLVHRNVRTDSEDSDGRADGRGAQRRREDAAHERLESLEHCDRDGH